MRQRLLHPMGDLVITQCLTDEAEAEIVGDRE